MRGSLRSLSLSKDAHLKFPCQSTKSVFDSKQSIENQRHQRNQRFEKISAEVSVISGKKAVQNSHRLKDENRLRYFRWFQIHDHVNRHIADFARLLHVA